MNMKKLKMMKKMNLLHNFVGENNFIIYLIFYIYIYIIRPLLQIKYKLNRMVMIRKVPKF